MITCIYHLDESTCNETEGKTARRLYTAMTWHVELTDVLNPIASGHHEGPS